MRSGVILIALLTLQLKAAAFTVVPLHPLLYESLTRPTPPPTSHPLHSRLITLFSKRLTQYPLPKSNHYGGQITNPAFTGANRRKPTGPGHDVSLIKPTRFNPNEIPSYECAFKNELKTTEFQPPNITRKTTTQTTKSKKRKRIFTNLHLQPKRNSVKHRFYGRPSKPCDILGKLEAYNQQEPSNQIHVDELKCDLLYCFSNGTIAFIKESALPHNNEISDEYYKQTGATEAPRFIVQVMSGHVKEHQLKVGDELDALNEKNREEIFDNHFARPRCYREPLKLPDGRYIP